MVSVAHLTSASRAHRVALHRNETRGTNGLRLLRDGAEALHANQQLDFATRDAESRRDGGNIVIAAKHAHGLHAL